MKKLFTAIGLFLSLFSFAQTTPMITRWITSSSTDSKIAINTKGGGLYTYKKVDDQTITGKGMLDDAIKKTIYLPEPGEYIVEIMPISDYVPCVFYMGQVRREEASELVEIMQWGNFLRGNSGSLMFAGCKNLKITATDVPDFSEMVDMSNMFYGCSSITDIPNINKWNVSNVTDMENMFFGVYQFNSDISSWDTSNVIRMSRMFAQNDSKPGKFNQNISNWNTKNVTRMSGMFRNCTEFNQSLSKWNTEKVYDFSGMFEGAYAFNQDISNFNLAKAKNIDYMFDYSGISCGNYNKILEAWANNSATPYGLKLSAQNVKYSDATYRNKLVYQKNWTINGDTYDKSCKEYFLSVDDISSNNKTAISINTVVKDILKINTNNEVSKIEIYSLSGKLIKILNQKENNITDLKTGIYLVNVYQNNNIKSFKIIKL